MSARGVIQASADAVFSNAGLRQGPVSLYFGPVDYARYGDALREIGEVTPLPGDPLVYAVTFPPRGGVRRPHLRERGADEPK